MCAKNVTTQGEGRMEGGGGGFEEFDFLCEALSPYTRSEPPEASYPKRATRSELPEASYLKGDISV